MPATIKTRFETMGNFLDSYVEEFICDTGLDESIDFLSLEYTKYKSGDNNALYCHPYTLSRILISLKGFIGVNSFTTYTHSANKQRVNTHNFISTFLEVCSVRPITTRIVQDDIESDVSYITNDYSLDKIDSVIQQTKNVIIIENIHRIELINHLDKHSRHHIISYYHAKHTTNPIASAAIIYKDFSMFD